jgi:hypothetical protein
LLVGGPAFAGLTRLFPSSTRDTIAYHDRPHHPCSFRLPSSFLPGPWRRLGRVPPDRREEPGKGPPGRQDDQLVGVFQRGLGRVCLRGEQYRAHSSWSGARSLPAKWGSDNLPFLLGGHIDAMNRDLTTITSRTRRPGTIRGTARLPGGWDAGTLSLRIINGGCSGCLARIIRQYRLTRPCTFVCLTDVESRYD